MARRLPDEDTPWLDEAEPVGARRSAGRTEVSRRSLFWTVVGVLALAAVAIAGGLVLFGKRQTGSTAGFMNAEQAPLIAADPGPYKLAPTDPRGLQVEGQDQTLYAAGEGSGPAGQIDMSAVPEEPMARPDAEGPPKNLLPPPVTPPVAAPPAAATPMAPVAARPATTSPAPAVTTAAPVPAKLAAPIAKPVAPKPADSKATDNRPPDSKAGVPALKATDQLRLTLAPKAGDAPKPAAVPKAKPHDLLAQSGPQLADEPPVREAPPVRTRPPHTVQLGAFSSPEKAEAAWAAAAAKSPKLAGKRKQVVAVESGGKTLYRLRATGPDAAGLCDELKAAGLACSMVD